MKEFDANLGEWHFHFTEAGLSPSDEIDKMATECNLFRPPTIIFGSNSMRVSHGAAHFSLLYDSREALKLINYEQRVKSMVPIGA